MPTVAIIDGILILIYLDDHAPPHFHVRKDVMKGKFEIVSGRLISGQVDRRTQRKVQEWTSRNQELLTQAWDRCQTTGKTGTTK